MAVTTRPELLDLFTGLSGLSWEKQKTVMLCLGVPQHSIDDIEAKHPTSDDTRRMDALECWLKTDASATWQKLMTALRDCGLVILSQIIEGQYAGVKWKSFTGGATTKPIPVSPSAPRE